MFQKALLPQRKMIEIIANSTLFTLIATKSAHNVLVKGTTGNKTTKIQKISQHIIQKEANNSGKRQHRCCFTQFKDVEHYRNLSYRWRLCISKVEICCWPVLHRPALHLFCKLLSILLWWCVCVSCCSVTCYTRTLSKRNSKHFAVCNNLDALERSYFRGFVFSFKMTLHFIDT